MIISVKPCLNCGADKVSDFKEYDGMLGYEAIVCKRCDWVYDETGAHSPEEWYGDQRDEMALQCSVSMKI